MYTKRLSFPTQYMNNIPHIVDTGASPIEPAGWIGYQEGHLVSFLKTQKQVNSFLTATDPTGRVEPVYTHPVKELYEAIKIIKDFQNSDVPPCKYYENTYADGWIDACNEILWAIEEKAQEK